jgi:ketosteroid isomerase-like protein
MFGNQNIMNTSLIKACESFSEGDSALAQEFLAKNVHWTVVGEKTIHGIDALKAFCAEATQHGCPDFQNAQTVVGKDHVVIQGAERKDGGVAYCDVYRVEDASIVEITSYCICPAKK